MVYVDTTRQTQRIFIPLGLPADSQGITLLTRETTDQREVAWPIAQAKVQGYLLRLAVSLPEGFGPGEWEYRLDYESGGQPASVTGLLDARAAQAPDTEYNNEIEYKQYES